MRKSNILFHFSSKYGTSELITCLAYLKQLSFGEGRICMGAWQCTKVSTNRLVYGGSQRFEGKDFCQSSEAFVPLVCKSAWEAKLLLGFWQCRWNYQVPISSETRQRSTAQNNAVGSGGHDLQNCWRVEKQDFQKHLSTENTTPSHWCVLYCLLLPRVPRRLSQRTVREGFPPLSGKEIQPQCVLHFCDAS